MVGAGRVPLGTTHRQSSPVCGKHRGCHLGSNLAGQSSNALNEIIAVWTASQGPEETQRVLQEAGVAAHRILNSAASYADPQLQHRGEFVGLDHPVHGKTTVEGARDQLSRTPAEYRFCAPTFGRDNEFVLTEILRYDDEKVTELIIASALE